jgi:nucleotide-binding universal stress UspA family protein
MLKQAPHAQLQSAGPAPPAQEEIMYRHMLVPTDGTELSTETVGSAVEFARKIGATITFFYATPDYLATSDGAIMRSISPEIAAEKAAGDARAILSKAEAAARTAGVSHRSLCKSATGLTRRFLKQPRNRAAT